MTLLKQYAGTTFDYFDKPTAGYSIGQTMISQGADIIFTAAGGTGIGTFNAIGQYDQQQHWNWSSTTPPPVFGIGVDANQDYYGSYQYFVQHHNQTGATLTPPSFILTSEIKTVDKGVFVVMKSVVYHNFTGIYNNPSKFGPSFYSGAAHVCGPDYGSPCFSRGVWEFGLDTGAVGPTDFHYTSMYLTPTATNVLNQITKGILNGSIVIPEDYAHA